MGFYVWPAEPGVTGGPLWVEPFGLDWDRIVAPRVTRAVRTVIDRRDRVVYRARLVVAAVRGREESTW